MITHKRLLELLKYDPLTGECINLITRGRAKIGMVAGSIHSTTKQHKTMLDRKIYKVSELAYFYMTGHWCAGRTDGRNQIVHIDHNRSNNIWSNLRPGTRREIEAYQPLNKTNTSGYTGVDQIRHGNWRSRIRVDGKNFNIGTYPTPEEAADAYDEFKRKLHPFR